MEYEHPLYTPASVAAQRRLPEIDTDRIAFAGAYHGWGFHEDGARSGLAAATRLGLPWTRATHVLPEPGRFETTIRHTGARLQARVRAHVDHLARRRRRPPRPRSAGPLRGARPPRLAGPVDPRQREAFLADNGVRLGDGARAGTILMAAQPRSLGYCFNPISVFWCFDDAGAQAGVVIEVHNTYGDRHAYLVHPDEQGRATTGKAMYVSPFHGVDGTYEIAVPVPTDRLHVAVTLRGPLPRGDRRRGALQRQPHRQPQRRAPPQDHRRRAARQRADPGPRHLAVGAPPAHPQPTQPSPGGRAVTLEKTAPSSPAARACPRWSRSPPAPAPRSRPRSPSGCSTPPSPSSRSPSSRSPPAAGSVAAARSCGCNRPDEFYARLGRDGLIGFGEAYLTGAWDARTSPVPHRPRGPDRHPDPPAPAARPRAGDARACPATSGAPRPTARPTSRTTTTCRTTCSALPRRDAELFLGPLRHLRDLGPGGPGIGRRAPARHAAGAGRPRRPAPPRPRPRRGPGPQDRADARRGRRHRRQPACSRSAPAGASWRSAPPAAARTSTPSPSPSSSSSWPSSGSRQRASPTASRSS